MQTIELMTKFDDRNRSPVDKESQSFDKVFPIIIYLFYFLYFMSNFVVSTGN